MSIFGGAVWGSGAGGGSDGGPTGTVPASKLFYAALRKAGVTLAPGRTNSDDVVADCLEECNRMIGGWNCERPNIFTARIDQFDLTGAKSYTIGKDPAGAVTADFDAPRPQQIIKANLIFPTNPAIRRDIDLVTDMEWGSIALQDIAAAPAFKLYNDGAYPFSNLSLWPQPPAGYSLELFSWQSIPKFASKDDVCTLSDGYEDAIVCNLALRLHEMPWPVKPHLDAQRFAALQQQAARSLYAIAQKNMPEPPKRVPAAPGCGGRGSQGSWADGWVR